MPAAAVFTSNLVQAAPVQVSKRHLASTGGRAAAVIVNSGNANAATGTAGLDAARAMCSLAARQLGVGAEEVLVCSTGLIGIPLQMSPIEHSMPRLAASLGVERQHGGAAARAVMTTDTFPKEVHVEGQGFVVGGLAKGAAMLAPNMATMLAVLTTDAAVSAPGLRRALGAAIRPTFNALSVDGCTSTNDTVIVLASGLAARPGDGHLEAALTCACQKLAALMAADAEGGTKVVRVAVSGATSDRDAIASARSVAESLLVKCSLYGSDPYWGRVLSELGSSGATLHPDRVSVAYGGETVCRNGVGAPHDERSVRAHLAGGEIELHCDLGLGNGSATVLTSDLGHGYIDENMRTS